MSKLLIQAFGETLKGLRNDKGISQEELAFKADLDRTFISMLERGVRQPTLTTIFQISEVLDVSVADLLKKAERIWKNKISAQSERTGLLRAAEPLYGQKPSSKRRSSPRR